MLYLLVAIAQNCKKINQKIIKKTVSCNGHGCRMSFLYNFMIQFFYNFKVVRPTNALFNDHFSSVHDVYAGGGGDAVETAAGEVVSLVNG